MAPMSDDTAANTDPTTAEGDESAPNPGNPFPDTDDVRHGADVHPALLGLLPLLGSWRGTGKAAGGPGGDEPAGAADEDWDFAQEVRFAHDGRPFMSYVADSWRIDADGRPTGAAERETGWWRPSGGDDFEVVLADPVGIVAIYSGRIDGVKFELSTDAVARTATAPEQTAARRLYGIVDGSLMYAVDTAYRSGALAPHHSARLERLGKPLT